MNCLDKIVFLDRDGVINEDVHYLSRVEDIKLIEGSKEAIKILKENGYKVVIVTNQSGVSRGYFTKEELLEINKVLNKMVDNMIDTIAICPHLPEDKCICRKPNVGLFDLVSHYFNIDLENSYMIGDKATDIMAGYNAKLKTIAVKTGYGETPEYADYVAENLLEAVGEIICKKQ